MAGEVGFAKTGKVLAAQFAKPRANFGMLVKHAFPMRALGKAKIIWRSTNPLLEPIDRADMGGFCSAIEDVRRLGDGERIAEDGRAAYLHRWQPIRRQRKRLKIESALA